MAVGGFVVLLLFWIYFVRRLPLCFGGLGGFPYGHHDGTASRKPPNATVEAVNWPPGVAVAAAPPLDPMTESTTALPLSHLVASTTPTSDPTVETMALLQEQTAAAPLQPQSMVTAMPLQTCDYATGSSSCHQLGLVAGFVLSTTTSPPVTNLALPLTSAQSWSKCVCSLLCLHV